MLMTFRYLLAERAFSRVTIFEQRSSVGGIWNYVPLLAGAPQGAAVPQTNPHAGTDQAIWPHDIGSKEHGQEAAQFLTPLYDRLETNIPRGLMGFSDLDWPQDCQLFPTHEDVLNYIERYAEDVRHLVRFSTQVVDVRLTSQKQWTVKTQDVSSKDCREVEVETFDAVVVASGHFNVPYIPDVPGIKHWNESYSGAISHSKFYRRPENFEDKKVLLVGASASGTDIGAQIGMYCKKPLLMSSKTEAYLAESDSSSKTEKPPITEYIVKDRTVCFEDGSIESGVDAVLYCTGYFYSFPFLNDLTPPILTTGERVENLYQHIFYRTQPSLAFPVLNQRIIPFPMAEAQAAVIARVFSGRLALPDEEEMEAWEYGVTSEMGDGRGFHVLKFPKDADYINAMHDWAVSADHIPCQTHRNGAVDGMQQDRAARVGKAPPYWGGKEYWTRERFPAIKQAFQEYGEARHSKRTLADVGFSFEEWNKATS